MDCHAAFRSSQVRFFCSSCSVRSPDGLPRRVPLLTVSVFLFFLFRAFARWTATPRSAPHRFGLFVLPVSCVLPDGLLRRVPLLTGSVFLFFLFRAFCPMDCHAAFRSSQFRSFCSFCSVRSPDGLPRRVPHLAGSVFFNVSSQLRGRRPRQSILYFS